MFWGINGLVLPVGQVRERLPTTLVHAALRTADGKQVTTSTTLTRLITTPADLLDVPQALMQRLVKASFLVQDQSGPGKHWDLVIGNVAGVTYQGSDRLTIHLVGGEILVDTNQAESIAWYSTFDTTGVTWPSPIQARPILMASELTSSMLNFDPTKVSNSSLPIYL
jgi:hypothetical protein